MAKQGASQSASKPHKGGKKNRKHGQNKRWCEAYRRRGQREKNKARKLRKHIVTHPTDKSATNALAAAKSPHLTVGA